MEFVITVTIVPAMIKRLKRMTRSRNCMLLSAMDFRDCLQKERYRADRSERVFSIVAVRLLDVSIDSREAKSIIRWLRLNLRITDEIGLLEDGRIGVLLTDTESEGALIVGERIAYECFSRELRYKIAVSTYPEERKESEFGDDSYLPPSEARPPSYQPTLLGKMFVQPTPLWKRATDVSLSLMLLVVLAPVMCLIALAIKVTSPGPMLFTQERSGLGGKPFRILKFRTMRADAERLQKELQTFSEQDGPAFKMTRDPRVTTLGRFLRKTSLDELPQLWNVIRGEMSLVGPRPLPSHETAQCEPWHRYRLDVVPGITCIWQVYGRSRVTFVDWIRMDLKYIRSRSPRQDASLICLTLPAVLSQRGAS